MSVTGNVVNGTIVLDQPMALPDGTRVDVAVRTSGYPPDEALVSRFRQLVGAWKAGKLLTSSGTEIALHPAYQQIIGMGREALPLIFEELQREEDHWFWALKAITGEDTVPPSERGRLPQMTAAWQRWAQAHGYLPCR